VFDIEDVAVFDDVVVVVVVVVVVNANFWLRTDSSTGGTSDSKEAS
jgi:hypothetical protein